MILLSVLIFFSLLVGYKVSGVSYFTPSKFSGLGYTIAINIFMLSLPGVLYISLIGGDNWRYESISIETKDIVFFSYLYSVFISIFILWIYNAAFKQNTIKISFTPCNYNNYNEKKLFELCFVFVVFYTLLRLLYLHPNPPLKVLIFEGVIPASIRRFEYQVGDVINKVPYISNILDSLSNASIYYISLFCLCKFKASFIKKTIILLSILGLSFYNLAYDIQKSPFVLYVVSLVYFCYLFYGFSRLYLYAFSLFLTLTLIFVSYQIDGNLKFEGSLIERLFTGQNQGLYLIVEHIVPNVKYAFSGMPFSGLFDLPQVTADVEVASYIYGAQAEHIVNVNSYYLAEAWSSLGWLGLVISPFIVWFIICIYYHLILYFFRRNILMVAALCFSYLSMIPINMRFNFFLYPKFMFINFLPVIFILYFFSKLKIYNSKAHTC